MRNLSCHGEGNFPAPARSVPTSRVTVAITSRVTSWAKPFTASHLPPGHAQGVIPGRVHPFPFPVPLLALAVLLRLDEGCLRGQMLKDAHHGHGAPVVCQQTNAGQFPSAASGLSTSGARRAPTLRMAPSRMCSREHR